MYGLSTLSLKIRKIQSLEHGKYGKMVDFHVSLKFYSVLTLTVINSNETSFLVLCYVCKECYIGMLETTNFISKYFKELAKTTFMFQKVISLSETIFR